ncbi:hypothetical protein NPIL_173511 [Nephila pilipes]|uniref:Uncharacterized protein n=1 Tax=Nephila pilipes TaxID=299642 RepID=A0A8X6MW01_NEPPI|nr:hypothetical protein NPIL_173511 [Nephila pilipes]
MPSYTNDGKNLCELKASSYIYYGEMPCEEIYSYHNSDSEHGSNKNCEPNDSSVSGLSDDSSKSTAQPERSEDNMATDYNAINDDFEDL